MNKERLFIIANRLPVHMDAENNLKSSAGGLVSAINSYLTGLGTKPQQKFDKTFWVGVPGCTPVQWELASASLPDDLYTYLPVYSTTQQYNAYYNGFSNCVLWPLFHYFPSYAEYSQEDYDCYLQMNTLFSDVLIKHLRPTDVVWIHDYHLLPLAGVIRKLVPGITIGFFLHIPFPSFEIFRLLPKQWQEELLSGILGADLIGFHTIDYASHFLQTVQMVLGLDNEMHIIRHDDRLIKVDVFPISIDFQNFHEAYNREGIAILRESIQEQLSGKKLIFSVDRLDYTKGVHNRLKAYEQFLIQHPDYREKVVFIIVVVPSRDTIPKYAERKKMIDETISNINSKIGTIHWQPIIYQYNCVSFEQMMALYTSCHLALITPLRDGMNLVAKEFVASRKDKRGVLVISEMAGAARELTNALTINPNDVNEMASKIKEGLEMNATEQQQRMEAMQDRIRQYDVTVWADDFLSQLNLIKKKQQEFQVKFLDDYSRHFILDAYRNADRRLLLFDYDGTLVPFTSHPSKAKPGLHLLQLIHDLSSQKENDLFIISGRNSEWLESCFGALPVSLVAEHGARIKWKSEGWTDQVKAQIEWRSGVQSIMDVYVKRCAGSFIEIKDFSIVWHYRSVAPEQAKLRSMELFSELTEHTRNRELQVLLGNKIVEVRNLGVHKGTAVKKILSRQEYNFILSVGDDRTDEDMFRLLVDKENCFTIKIGPEASFAQYNLHTPQMVIPVLESISRIKSFSLAG